MQGEPAARPRHGLRLRSRVADRDRRRRFRRGVYRRQADPLEALTIVGISVINFPLAISGWTAARDAGLVVGGVFWLASAFWVFKDARRRVETHWLVGLATLVGLAIPLLGPIVYLFFRPPEYLEDVRERELEIRAIEERLRLRSIECPVCRASVEATYVVCPICTTRLKQACTGCGAPLEAIWQACPYCATPILAASFDGQVLQPLRPHREHSRREP
jgi:double zinc ribbon protein